MCIHYYGEKGTPQLENIGGSVMILLGVILLVAFELLDKEVIKVERA